MYPLITSSNISLFKKNDKENEWTFFPYDVTEKSKQPLTINKIANLWPKLSNYICQIKQLIKPSQKSQYSQRVQNVSEDYGLLRVGKYAYAEHFVCCRNNTKWVSSYFGRVITPWQEKKMPLFEGHVNYITQDNKGNFISQNEAYYITAVLNAPIVKKFMEATNSPRNYSLKNISICCPKYDENNSFHLNLRDISHQIIEAKKDFNSSLAEKLNILYLQLCRSS